VRHGTSSSTSLGASCPSDCANGPTGSDQWDLVLLRLLIIMNILQDPFDDPLRLRPLTRSQKCEKFRTLLPKAIACRPTSFKNEREARGPAQWRMG
jgi:hypothetical protein